MRKFGCLLILLFIITFSVSHAQNTNKTTDEKVNGWHMLEDRESNRVGELIVKVTDFDSIYFEASWISSLNDSVYSIAGKVKKEKMKTFGDGTEKAIGKGIAFLYNGVVICTPVPNVRLDEGNFAISSQTMSLERAKMKEMYLALKKEMQHK